MVLYSINIQLFITLYILIMCTWWNPKYVPPDLRKRAIHLYMEDHTVPDIADRLMVGQSSVYRWIDTFRETGDVYTDKEHKQHVKEYQRPVQKKLNNIAATNELWATLDRSCVSTLKQYQESLLNVGIEASLPTVHRFWKANNVTYKKCSILANESDPLDVIDFWSSYHIIVDDINQVIFGDESHRNDHDSTRLYGRSSKGEPAYQVTNLTKGGYKLSLGCFGDHTGPVVYDAFDGGIDTDDFLDFAWNKLYDEVKPYPGKHSVIIIDNATVHHTVEWSEFVEQTETVCIYLAAYCPFLNLIEWMFNAIKQCEAQKQMKGEEAALISLIESTERQKGKPWHKVLEKIGYL